MHDDISQHASFASGSSAGWQPSARCRKWLLVGLFALLFDVVLAVIATVLEFENWGREGVTPDVIVIGVAIIPQVVIFSCYLLIAREMRSRRLWKSTAGLMCSYLLLFLLGLVLLDILPNAVKIVLDIVAAVGIVALLVFSLSEYPRFAGAANSANTPGPLSEAEPARRVDWKWQLIALVVFLVFRGLFRRFIMPFFDRGLAVDDWAMVEAIALLVACVSFALWFAITKIGLRAHCGNLACWTGCIELLILLLHFGLAVLILEVIIAGAAANPRLDEAGIDRMLTPWMQGGSLLSLACHLIWGIVTAFFFGSIRRLSFVTATPHSSI